MSRTPTLVAAALFVATAPALAASTNWCGKLSGSLTLYENPGSALWFSSYSTVLDATVAIVYKNASMIGLYMADDDDYDTVNGNGESEFTFTYGFVGECGATAGGGCTQAWYNSSSVRVETDVFMDASTSWDTSLGLSSTWGYGGSKRALLTTLLHEFGHSLSLGHEARYYNIMGTDWTHRVGNGSSYTDQLGEDATSGLRSMYGSTTGGYEDLSVSHWKYDSAGTGTSEYSAHKRTTVQDSAGTELSKTTVSDQPIYTITKGAKGKVEVTVENNGASGQTTNLRIYLSADSTISSADTTLLTQSTYMAPDTPYTGSYSVTWPSSLTSGATWYVGACVDASGTLSEIREDNNCAYIAQLKVK